MGIKTIGGEDVAGQEPISALSPPQVWDPPGRWVLVPSGPNLWPKGQKCLQETNRGGSPAIEISANAAQTDSSWRQGAFPIPLGFCCFFWGKFLRMGARFLVGDRPAPRGCELHPGPVWHR